MEMGCHVVPCNGIRHLICTHTYIHTHKPTLDLLKRAQQPFLAYGVYTKEDVWVHQRSVTSHKIWNAGVNNTADVSFLTSSSSNGTIASAVVVIKLVPICMPCAVECVLPYLAVDPD